MVAWSVRPAAAVSRLLQHWLIVPVVGLALLAFYRALYFPLLVDAQGAMAGDYAVSVPNLLAGYYWYLENGVFVLPWFSPGQCGGIPFFADQAVFWFSLPQFLTFIINPVAAMKGSFLVFALAGYLGTYALIRYSFLGSRAAAFVGAILFMFNGFSTMRAVIGHPTFQPFMLMPLMCLAILRPPGRGPANAASNVFRILIFGIVLAVMVQASMFHAVPAVLIGTAMVALTHAAIFGFAWFPAMIATAGGLLASCLAIGKAAALAEFVAIFPRTNYSLPGFGNILDEILFIGRALFLRLPEHAQSHLTNITIAQGQHEFEIGVTAVPLVLTAIAAAQWVRKPPGQRMKRRYLLAWFGIVLLAAVPVLLNFYEPHWTGLLKTLPYFRNSSTLLRWNASFILPAIMIGAIALDRIDLGPRRLPNARSFLATVALAGAMVQTIANSPVDTGQTYQSLPVTNAWAKARQTGHPPMITAIAVSRFDPAQARTRDVNANNAITVGYSHRQCYQAMFGYGNENFPLANLTPRPVMTETGGLLNMKNPACYLFPRDNHCLPGAMFEVGERADLEAFVSWKPFPFVLPNYMKLVLALNQAALIMTLLALGWVGWSLARRRRG